MELRILYEDNHLIAVYKPAGMLVQGDVGGERCLMDEVKEYLKTKYHKPGNVFLGLLHRLDRPVQGIVLLAKTSKGASRLSEQFRNHAVKKIYHALVSSRLPSKKGTLINWLKKDENKNKTTVYDHEVPGALYAELAYEVKGTRSRLSSGRNPVGTGEPGTKIAEYVLVEIELKTGRSHQIRSQLAHIGCPIVGDLKYGAPEPLPDKSIALAAVQLTFGLPTSAEMQTISCPASFE